MNLCVGERREATSVDYEIHTAALRRTGMRALGLRGNDTLIALLSEHIGTTDARLIVCLPDGILVAALARDTAPSADEVRDAFERILGPSRR